ncbi:MAG: hypothetical protein D6675_12295 [Gemmatimonadetes bacterium]|nr:MAG: hypothetical protein D6675_12295 [Gemmatimonadota bacterium]
MKASSLSQKQAELKSMISYQIGRGCAVELEMIRLAETPLAEINPTALADAHWKLSLSLSPRRPELVHLMQSGSHSWASFLGAIPELRRWVIFHLLSVLVFVGVIVTAAQVNDLWWRVAAYTSGAILGATIITVLTLSQKVFNLVYQPEEDRPQGWLFGIRVGFGIALGFALPGDAMLPIIEPSIANPLLAVLGGYSGSIVVEAYRGGVRMYRLMIRRVQEIYAWMRESLRWIHHVIQSIHRKSA